MLKCESCTRCSSDTCSFYHRPVDRDFNGCFNHSHRVTNPIGLVPIEDLKEEVRRRNKEEEYKWIV